MTKPQSTAAYVLRLTLTLFLITVIVAGLLAFVNYLTADTIAEHTAEAAPLRHDARSSPRTTIRSFPCRTRRPPPA